MPKYIVANWKMHGTRAAAQTWAQGFRAHCPAMPGGVTAVVCPPAVLMEQLQALPAALGGQDCHAMPEGAFTGDISAPMLKDAGCAYVIVGHSERRALHQETSETVRAKAESAIAAGLTPIICIGETRGERDAGRAPAVVQAQVEASVPSAAPHFLLAYEPVWAIGSGQVPDAREIGQMHAHIRATVASRCGFTPAVLYGGSVNAENARAIMAIDGVGGVLVGSASLDAEAFCRIVAAAIPLSSPSGRGGFA